MIVGFYMRTISRIFPNSTWETPYRLGDIPDCIADATGYIVFKNILRQRCFEANCLTEE